MATRPKSDPLRAPVQPALQVGDVARRSPATPNLTAQKSNTARKTAPRIVPITTEQLRKMDYSDPRRMAHLRGGQQGYLDYMSRSHPTP